MLKIYEQFSSWRFINKTIPLEKFYVWGRMSEKQSGRFRREVTTARILFKNEDCHVIEMQIENIYPRDKLIFGWVRAVFQTMPYDILLVLNCRSKYYLFLEADIKDRQNHNRVSTDKVVTDIYGNMCWIDGENFDEGDLQFDSDPIDSRMFPHTIPRKNPNQNLTFIDDFNNTVVFPYPSCIFIEKNVIVKYTEFVRKRYNSYADEFSYLDEADREYAFADFLHETEKEFALQHEIVFNEAQRGNDEHYNHNYYCGFVGGELVKMDEMEKYIDRER